MAGNAKDPGRSVISKISAILLTLSEGNGPTLTEIASWSELPLSTVHRLASELAAWGLLERDENGRYWAGSPLRAFGVDGTSPATANDGLRDRIAPVMEDLFRTTGAQVRAGWLDATNVAYVEKVSGHVPVTQPCAAARLPAHATAVGKTLMAFSPIGVADAIIARGLIQYTRATITKSEQLRWAIRRIRTLRIALCDRELNDDWSGVAAPVFGPGGAVLAAIELRVHDLARDLPMVRAPLAVAAACVSRELTVQKPSDVRSASWGSRRDLLSIPTVRAEDAFRRMPRTHTGRDMEPA